MITIGTQRNLPDAHYIGRNGDSSLGNPFAAAGNTVANVVKGYSVYIFMVAEHQMNPGQAARATIAANPELKLHISSGWKIPTVAQVHSELSKLLDDIREGKPVALACHCYNTPAEWTGKQQNRCHAEPIARWLLWKAAQSKLPVA